MSIPKQIVVSVGRTVSRDYNSTRVDYSVTVDLDEADDIDREYDRWTDDLKARVKSFFVPKADQLSTDTSARIGSTADQAVARGHWQDPKG